MTPSRTGPGVWRISCALGGHRRAARLVERNLMVYRRTWLVLVSGFLEPLFYLFSIGVGIGKLVPVVHAPGHAVVSYTAYVAPALLAASAMNGAVYDSTFNVFHRLNYAKVYEAVLATPVGVDDLAVGEVTWALLRGALYASGFLVVMAALGLVRSPAAVAALPVCLVLGFGFAGVGMAATTFMRSWQNFEFVQLTVLPLFLFSATFYPLSVYPAPLRLVVRATPLYQGVALLRGLILGGWDAADLGHLAYLVGMGAVGLVVARARLGHLLRR